MAAAEIEPMSFEMLDRIFAEYLCDCRTCVNNQLRDTVIRRRNQAIADDLNNPGGQDDEDVTGLAELQQRFRALRREGGKKRKSRKGRKSRKHKKSRKQRKTRKHKKSRKHKRTRRSRRR